MGWYDAFKGHPERVNTMAITSNSGSAAKNFGDAFKDIGKSMQAADAQRSKDALFDAQAKFQTTKDKQLNQTLQTQTDTTEQKKIDDAFKKDFNFNSGDTEYQKQLLEFEKPDGVFDSDVSNSALEYANNKIASDEKIAQQNFNDEAIKESSIGNYKDMDSFTKENPTLVKNADGTTMTKIENRFASKKAELAKLEAKNKEILNNKKLLSMQEKLVKANKGKSGFKYDDKTDAKIAAQVKTALGMDNQLLTFDDAKKKEYQDTVAGAAKISKKYNLEPSLAIHVYENPDLYEFTADNKVIMKKQPEATVKEEKKSTSWKDYI